MGPSGSGKTSLLSIVGARAQRCAPPCMHASQAPGASRCVLTAVHGRSHMRQEGLVTFNGQALTKRLRRQIGFVLQARRAGRACLHSFSPPHPNNLLGCAWRAISRACWAHRLWEPAGGPAHGPACCARRPSPYARVTLAPAAQDDLLYENLTVYETLYYAAMLRLPRDMPEPEKVARVDAVIAALGIDSCRNTIIGAPPAARRAMSSALCLSRHARGSLRPNIPLPDSPSLCDVCWERADLSWCE